MVRPGTFGFMPFCLLGEVSLMAGAPPMNRLAEPMAAAFGPIIRFEATPSSTPALSPLERGTCVVRLCAGIPSSITLVWVGTAVLESAMFG